MKIDWEYDNPGDGCINVDPEDFIGRSLEEIESMIYTSCVADARRDVEIFIPGLYSAAREIKEEADRLESDGDQ